MESEPSGRLHELLKALGRGNENAYFSLIEMGVSILDEIRSAYKKEEDPSIRSQLVEVAYQNDRSGNNGTIEFLKEALNDPSKEVWNIAISGLLSVPRELGEPVLKDTLAHATKGTQFYEYIEEAIALLDWPFNKPSNEGDKDKVE